MKQAVVLLFLSFVLVACGGGYNPDLAAENEIPEFQKLGSYKAKVLAGDETLQFSQEGLEGTGAVVFAEKLSRPESANNFILSFELEDGGSLVLVTNSTEKLSSGVSIEFSRAQGSQTLSVIAKAGDDTYDMSSFFTDLDPSIPLAISIDIHNDHGPSAHVIFWDENNKRKMIVEDMIDGRGLGSQWGLTLSKAKVFGLAKNGPREKH